MNGTDFLAFRRRMGIDGPLSERKTAQLLGCSRHSIRSWSHNGAPHYVGLACQAIAHGLKPWGNNQNQKEKAA